MVSFQLVQIATQPHGQESKHHGGGRNMQQAVGPHLLAVMWYYNG